MATRAAAICLEMLRLGQPERLRHAAVMQPTRGGCMATRAAAICLEMLRAGEPERLEAGREEGVFSNSCVDKVRTPIV